MNDERQAVAQSVPESNVETEAAMPGVNVRFIEAKPAGIIDREKRIVEAVISTNNVDRFETRIVPSGLKYDNYLRYGTVLFNHRQDFPIGKCLSIIPTDTEVRAQWQFFNFSNKPPSEWGDIGKKVEDLWYLYEGGYLKAYSIGFIPHEITQDGLIPSAELLEFSLVCVPANPFALAQDEKAVRCFRNVLKVGDADEPAWRTFSKLFADSVKAEVRALVQDELARSVTVTSGFGIPMVIPPDQVGIVEERKRELNVNAKGRAHANALIDDGKIDFDSPWEWTTEDEDKILGNDDWENYAKWFLAVDPSADPKTKAHYAFPYGKNGKVYREGVITAKRRAAQFGHTEIEEVADRLLQKIDKKQEEKDFAALLSLALSVQDALKNNVKLLESLQKDMAALSERVAQSEAGIVRLAKIVSSIIRE